MEMNKCIECGRVVCSPCNSLEDEIKQTRVCVASHEQLTRLSYHRRLVIALANLPVSRRVMLDWMTSIIFSFLEDGGTIEYQNGIEYEITDDPIGDNFDEDGRWISDQITRSGLEPAQRPQLRTIERWRLIDLAIRIAHPNIARHFDR